MKNKKEITDLKPNIEGEKISRKEALHKAGLIAFSAASMMLLLNNTVKGDGTDSPDLPPEWQ